MNKKELLKTLRREHNECRDKSLAASSKMYDWLKERKSGREYLLVGRTVQCYLINNYRCIATYLNYRDGIVELIPFNPHVDIGSGYLGGTLRINFNDIKQ